MNRIAKSTAKPRMEVRAFPEYRGPFGSRRLPAGTIGFLFQNLAFKITAIMLHNYQYDTMVKQFHQFDTIVQNY